MHHAPMWGGGGVITMLVTICCYMYGFDVLGSRLSVMDQASASGQKTEANADDACAARL